MYQDVGTPERQKVRKQGRDDQTNQWSIQSPLHIFFIIQVLWKKISVGGIVYFTVLCDHPYLVSLLFAVLVSLHPSCYILNVFYYFM